MHATALIHQSQKTPPLFPNCKETFKKRAIEISRVAIQALLPFLAGLLCVIIFPAAVNIFALPLVVFGVAFLAAFLYVPDQKSTDHKFDFFSDETDSVQKTEIDWDYSVQAPIPPEAPPRGIYRGTTMNCWLITLLQMLRRDERIWNWLRNPPEDRPLLEFVPLGQFVRNYDQAILSNKPAAIGDIQAIRIALAQTAASNEISHHSYRQEDIVSGLDAIMNHSYLPEECRSRLIEVTYYFEPDHLPKIKGGASRSTTKDDWGLVTLPLNASEEPQSIQSLLPRYFEEQVEVGNNVLLEAEDGAFYMYPVIRREFRFQQAPEKIWIQMKRFEKDFYQTIKNSSPIQADSEIQIPTLDGPQTYRLDSFAVHQGRMLGSGHYNGYIGDYFCNDAEITQPNPEQRLKDSQQSYLLLYSRQ